MKTPCQIMAELAIGTRVEHYHGSVKADPKVLSNYKGRKGFFIKKFLINNKLNQNKWKVTWDAIKKDVWDFIGKPVVVTPDRDHPAVKDQEDYRVGEIIDVGLDEASNTAWQVSEIFDKDVQKKILNKELEFGSPTVIVRSNDTREIRAEGTEQQTDILHRFIPAHDALVADPAYGKNTDNIAAVCRGDGEACALKLLTVQASKKFKAEVNSDNTDQLTVVPFVRGVIKKRFTSKTLKEIVGRIRAADLNDCVSNKIKILADEHPTWEHDKVIAVAYSYCRKSGQYQADLVERDLLVPLWDAHAKQNRQQELEAKLWNAEVYLARAEEKGRWVTIRGNKVFLPEGKDPEKAISEHFERLEKREPKKKPEGQKKETEPKEIPVKIERYWRGEGKRFTDKTLQIWNSIDPKFKAGVKKLLIGRPPETREVVGTFNTATKTVGIHLANSALTEESTDEEIERYVNAILSHELGHANYHAAPKSQQKKWAEKIKDIPPVTGYLARFFTGSLDEAKNDYEVMVKRKSNFLKSIAEQKEKLKKGNLTESQEALLISSLRHDESVLKDTKAEILVRKKKYLNYLHAFADETYAELQVFRMGHKPLWNVNEESFNKLLPIYKEVFGDG